MRVLRLLSAAAVVMALVLPPAPVGAQRESGRDRDRHRDGKSADRAGVKQPRAVRPTAVREVVIGPPVVVQQPIVAGWSTQGVPGATGFGSVPVRTGFGTQPIRTGFETGFVRTGFGAQTLTQIPPSNPRQESFRSKGFHHAKQRTGVLVIAYPVPYPYAYLPESGLTTSSTATYLPPFPQPSSFYGVTGVSAGLSTYWMDLTSETGPASGLSFNVKPAATQVYVDGNYLGTVQDFSIDSGPLIVVPGHHRLELRLRGYRTMALDVSLAAGQVIPYEGELEQLRPF